MAQFLGETVPCGTILHTFALMPRKKWTPKTEITDSLKEFNAKRRWQIALRRYVIEKNPSFDYAPYFALDIEKFRHWIELQFDENLRWSNFSSKWQFDHIVPVSNFDLENEADLRLCWNFINIRVRKRLVSRSKTDQFDPASARTFFENLYEHTHYQPAHDMVKKISLLEKSAMESPVKQQHFINLHKYYLNKTADFSDYEFDKLNYGISLGVIIEERELLKKYE